MMPARRKTPLPSIRHMTVPIPIGGINTVSAGTTMPATDSIYSYNLIGAEYGLRSRLGWREWCTGLDGEVRSILPFAGSTKDGANDRLFATTQTGIWDVSASSGSPTEVVTFATQSADSGYGNCSSFTDLNGDHWLAYCDEANGYYTYKESGATWTQITYGSGVGQMTELSGYGFPTLDPTKLCFVLPWKNRLWFVERDTGRAWYLGPNQITGGGTAGAAPFYFGSRFKAGGDLRCLASWTIDGGSGPDDRLVAISGGGDIVIYAGTDPASVDTFSIVGVWSAGSVPYGRHLVNDFGGDLVVLSSTGIIPISRLAIGNPIVDRTQYSTFKISNLFNQLMAATSTLKGWGMALHPQDACLMVLVPTAVNQASQQLVMSLTTRGWHIYRDMPVGLCAAPWGNTLYFGTQDGRVCANDGYLDGVTRAGTGFTTINWSLLTSYQNLGSPLQKRIVLIRPTVLSQGGSINFQTTAKYKWDLTEGDLPQSIAAVGTSLWDSGLWDTAVWGGAYSTQQKVFGAAGVGPEAAIAIRGSASSRMTLAGIDVSFNVGGML